MQIQSLSGVRDYRVAKKRKPSKLPHDPAEIARLRLNAKLPMNANVVIEPATRKNVERARRYDCFALLHSRKAISDAGEQAVRRLQEDIAILHKTAGTERLEVVVDGGSNPASWTHAQMGASDRLIDVQQLVFERLVVGLAGDTREFLDRARKARLYHDLLRSLIDPEAIHGQTVNWRGVVSRVTGEHRDKHQAEWVSSACEALAEAYRQIDHEPKPKRAA